VNRCSSCDANRRRFLCEGLRFNCKEQRLCDIVELRIVEIAYKERGRPQTIDQINELSSQIRDGHNAALFNLYDIVMPASPQLFKETLLHMHNTIFGRTNLSFSGRFRKEGEDGVRYGSRKHEREALPASEIEIELEHLYDSCINNFKYDETKERISRKIAIFLERFFRIHPFHDGNGRVARLFTRRLVYETGRLEIPIYDIKGQFHDIKGPMYIKALEAAHARCDDNINYCGEVLDPYKALAAWVQSQIRELPQLLSEPDSPPA
jgi:Fic family protein